MIVLYDPKTLLQIKTQGNTNLLISARVTPNFDFFLLIHKSFRVIHTF